MRGLMPGIEFMKEEERRLRRLRLRRLAGGAVPVAVWAAIVTLLIVYACTR